MSVELPKDAKGREIPLDTKVLYDSDGTEFFTDKLMYMRIIDKWWFFGHFGSLTSTHRIEATKLYLTPPDSWEKLEEDLGRGAGMLNYEACAYFGKSARLFIVHRRQRRNLRKGCHARHRIPHPQAEG